MKLEIPCTIGYEIDRALQMLEAFHVVMEETSTVFEDKKEERKDRKLVVIRQCNAADCIRLTVARFR